MANSNKDNSNKVSLEELLRFKRAERPDEIFWERFDHELHERMMQTLVKKEAWYVQLMRGLTGKIAQTSAIAAAAAVLALMVIRPALISSSEPGFSRAPTLAATTAGVEAEVTERSVSTEHRVDPALLAAADYKIEGLSASAEDGNKAVTQHYQLDHLDVASYDRSVYSADMALSGFTAAGVASIVY